MPTVRKFTLNSDRAEIKIASEWEKIAPPERETQTFPSLFAHVSTRMQKMYVPAGI